MLAATAPDKAEENAIFNYVIFPFSSPARFHFSFHVCFYAVIYRRQFHLFCEKFEIAAPVEKKATQIEWKSTPKRKKERKQQTKGGKRRHHKTLFFFSLVRCKVNGNENIMGKFIYMEWEWKCLYDISRSPRIWGGMKQGGKNEREINKLRI